MFHILVLLSEFSLYFLLKHFKSVIVVYILTGIAFKHFFHLSVLHD